MIQSFRRFHLDPIAVAAFRAVFTLALLVVNITANDAPWWVASLAFIAGFCACDLFVQINERV